MAFQFIGKRVIILSPEKWGSMRFSKHHYALELANLGNTVFFIEPSNIREKGVKVTPVPDSENLKVVSYKPVFRGKKYLPRLIYRLLIRFQIQLINSKIGGKADVVICFDPYRFLNLKWFGADVNIFFLADLLPLNYIPEEANTADFSLALSESRKEQIIQSVKPVHLINHGLSRFYVQKSEERLSNNLHIPQPPKSRITAGYIGNLLMGAIDRKTMIRVITENPDVCFKFWGQFEKNGQLIPYDTDEVNQFINFLKKSANVKLSGPVHPEQLSHEIDDVDIFWVCWDLSIGKVWDGSNPHKVLEYLSTGKPLVSHFMDVYKNSDLVIMNKTKDSKEYPALFRKGIEMVKKGETELLIRKRIEFALENSYVSQLKKIEQIVNASQHEKIRS